VFAHWSVQEKKKNSINIVLCSFDVSEHLDQEQDFWNTCYPEEVEEEATKIFLC
jgi:hypothetical protein